MSNHYPVWHASWHAPIVVYFYPYTGEPPHGVDYLSFVVYPSTANLSELEPNAQDDD